MKAKTLAWMLLPVCAGWYVGTGAGPLPDPSAPAEMHGNTVLSRSGTVVELADDGELAQRRGKYLGASIVSGSMIEMISQWRNEAGQATVEARLFATDLYTSTTSIAVSTLTSVQMGMGTLADAIPGATVPDRVDVQIDGVGQMTQVTGNNNLANNTTSTSVRSAPLPTLPSGSALATAARNGLTTQAQADAGGVQVAIISPVSIVS